jgi:hypothetical protein
MSRSPRQTRHIRHTIQIQDEEGDWYNYESGTLEEMSERMDKMRSWGPLNFRLVRVVTVTTIMETKEDGEDA